MLDPIFGPFFIARLVTTAAVWIHNIVAAILAFELSGSALVVGLVSVAQFGPQLVLAPLSGALADRGDRRIQLIIGRLVVAGGSGGLALWIWLVGVDGLPGAWAIMLAAFVVGIGFVIVSPAQGALIPALIRPSELAAAMALQSVPPILARASGPAIGALVAVSVGPFMAFMITAVANLAFALAMLPMEMRSRARRQHGSDQRIRAGLRYLRADPAIGRLLIAITAVGLGADPVITLSPSLSAQVGEGSALVGAFASSFGVGAGVAFLILGRLRRRIGQRHLATIGLLLMSLGMGAAGLGPTIPLIITSLSIAGAGMTLSLSSFSTLMQERLPDELRGRLMSLWAMAFLGSRSIAASMNGSVADAFGTTAALLLVAALVSAAAWSCRPSQLAPPITGRASAGATGETSSLE